MMWEHPASKAGRKLEEETGEMLVEIDGEEFNTEVSFEYGVRD